MRHRTVDVGAAILAVLGLLDALAPSIMPAPPEAPSFADPMSLAFGVVTLVALGVWLARGSRVAMWVAVVLRVISALFAVPAFLAGVSVGLQVVLVVVVLATIAGVVLVRPALARPRAGVTA